MRMQLHLPAELVQFLYQGVSSGDLEFSDSKAAFLQNLCEELHCDPQKATEIHEEIYRQKLQQCAADGVLSDEDVKALTRLRVMLCIPQHTIDAVHYDICGSLFEKDLSFVLPAKLFTLSPKNEK
ncbi:PROTEIN TIC110 CHLOROPLASTIC [Salix purpurea]|uniref:PROTEIN TIC110 CHLOROPLASTIC n=1 Tax=Salix purpurea TaxID=77065 RepID=A0A9Q0ZSG4_SALPP|nr:PROTEIN TIC110 CHLOROPLASTIC [Salix purpurea]